MATYMVRLENPHSDLSSALCNSEDAALQVAQQLLQENKQVGRRVTIELLVGEDKP